MLKQNCYLLVTSQKKGSTVTEKFFPPPPVYSNPNHQPNYFVFPVPSPPPPPPPPHPPIIRYFRAGRKVVKSSTENMTPTNIYAIITKKRFVIGSIIRPKDFQFQKGETFIPRENKQLLLNAD